MNYHTFYYLPPVLPTVHDGGQVGTGSSCTRKPIRVTPSCLRLLLYSILYSIEFQAPVGPLPIPSSSENCRRPSSNATASVVSSAMLSAVSGLLGRKLTSAASFTFPGKEQGDEEELCTPWQHQQFLVRPVTQAIYPLGGVHIVVRERHNPTVELAHARALADAEAIITRHQERQVQRVSLKVLVNSSGQYGGGSSDSPRYSLDPVLSSFPSESRSTRPHISASNASSIGSPTQASGGKRPAEMSRTSLLQYAAGPEEVGLELYVRLSTRESKWGMQHERPLAEWVFPIIRTKDEDKLYRPSGLHTEQHSGQEGVLETFQATPMHAQPSAPGSTQGSASPASPLAPVLFPTKHVDFVFVNDASQIYDVQQFILKTFYDAISLETFSDFRAGELVFDAHIIEKRMFITGP